VDHHLASSVFTHHTEPDQDHRLQEVHPVLSPGGLAVISLAGFEMHWRMRDGHTATRSPELMGRLARMPELVDVGFHFEPYEIGGWNAADFAGIEDVYGLAFHMPEYVAAHWAPWLVELGRHYSVVNGWQDLVLFERAGQAPSSR
jgi:hypothetical protein